METQSLLLRFGHGDGFTFVGVSGADRLGHAADTVHLLYLTGKYVF